MSCYEVVPAREDNLCDLLAKHKVAVRVLEVKSDDGKWVWQTQATPRLLTYDYGNWAGGAGWVVCYGQGDTAEAAIESLCRSLSGNHVRIEKQGWVIWPWSTPHVLDLNLTQVKVSL